MKWKSLSRAFLVTENTNIHFLFKYSKIWMDDERIVSQTSKDSYVSLKDLSCFLRKFVILKEKRRKFVSCRRTWLEQKRPEECSGAKRCLKVLLYFRQPMYRYLEETRQEKRTKLKSRDFNFDRNPYWVFSAGRKGGKRKHGVELLVKTHKSSSRLYDAARKGFSVKRCTR